MLALADADADADDVDGKRVRAYVTWLFVPVPTTLKPTEAVAKSEGMTPGMLKVVTVGDAASAGPSQRS